MAPSFYLINSSTSCFCARKTKIVILPQEKKKTFMSPQCEWLNWVFNQSPKHGTSFCALVCASSVLLALLLSFISKSIRHDGLEVAAGVLASDAVTDVSCTSCWSSGSPNSSHSKTKAYIGYIRALPKVTKVIKTVEERWGKNRSISQITHSNDNSFLSSRVATTTKNEF